MQMEAIVVNRFGGPEVLEFQTIETPKPGPDDVIVKVEAVSVNRSFDIGAREGKSQFKLTPPLVLGVDPTGTIVEAGSNIDPKRVGERVFATFLARCGTCDNCRKAGPCSNARQIGITAPGGYAQYVSIPSFQARKIPAELDAGTASVIGRHGEAAWSEIESADVKAGERVLIMGAAGGLGSLLIQMSKLRGATVIAVASSEERLAFCRDLGADHGVNYREGNITEQVMEITGGAGVNIVFENVSDPSTFPQALASLGRGGRLVTIGYHGGAVVPVDIRVVFRNQLTIKSSPMWSKDTEAFGQCFKLAAEGQLLGKVGARFALKDAAEAHRAVASSAVIGKVVLEP